MRKGTTDTGWDLGCEAGSSAAHRCLNCCVLGAQILPGGSACRDGRVIVGDYLVKVDGKVARLPCACPAISAPCSGARAPLRDWTSDSQKACGQPINNWTIDDIKHAVIGGEETSVTLTILRIPGHDPSKGHPAADAASTVPGAEQLELVIPRGNAVYWHFWDRWHSVPTPSAAPRRPAPPCTAHTDGVWCVPHHQDQGPGWVAQGAGTGREHVGGGSRGKSPDPTPSERGAEAAKWKAEAEQWHAEAEKCKTKCAELESANAGSASASAEADRLHALLEAAKRALLDAQGEVAAAEKLRMEQQERSRTTISVLEGRVAGLEGAGDARVRELLAELRTLRERLAVLEGVEAEKADLVRQLGEVGGLRAALVQARAAIRDLEETVALQTPELEAARSTEGKLRAELASLRALKREMLDAYARLEIDAADKAQMLGEERDAYKRRLDHFYSLPNPVGVGIHLEHSRRPSAEDPQVETDVVMVVGLLAGMSAEASGAIVRGDCLLEVDGIKVPQSPSPPLPSSLSRAARAPPGAPHAAGARRQVTIDR